MGLIESGNSRQWKQETVSETRYIISRIVQGGYPFVDLSQPTVDQLARVRPWTGVIDNVSIIGQPTGSTAPISLSMSKDGAFHRRSVIDDLLGKPRHRTEWRAVDRGLSHAAEGRMVDPAFPKEMELVVLQTKRDFERGDPEDERYVASYRYMEEAAEDNNVLASSRIVSFDFPRTDEYLTRFLGDLTAGRAQFLDAFVADSEVGQALLQRGSLGRRLELPFLCVAFVPTRMSEALDGGAASATWKQLFTDAYRQVKTVGNPDVAITNTILPPLADMYAERWGGSPDERNEWSRACAYVMYSGDTRPDSVLLPSSDSNS